VAAAAELVQTTSVKMQLRHLNGIMDSKFFEGNDFKVELTERQTKHYLEIFETHDVKNEGHIEIPTLARMMQSMGYGLTEDDLQTLIQEAHIEEDQDGHIDQDEFLEFVRQSLVEDLPSNSVDELKDEFEKRSIRRALFGRRPIGENLMTDDTDDEMEKQLSDKMIAKEQTVVLLKLMGFQLDETSVTDIYKIVATDSNGDLSWDEFVFGIGILKKQITELKKLEESWQVFVDAHNREIPWTKRRRWPDISSEDVAHALKVPQNEADDLVFVAGLDCSQSDKLEIGFFEFHSIITNF